MAELTRPRVMVCLNSLELGGTQINAVDLATCTRHHGFETHLVGWRGPRMGLLEVARERDFPIKVMDRAATSVGRARSLHVECDRIRPDLVHVYGAVDARAGFWGAARFGRVPLVLTVYEMSLPRYLYRSPALIVGTGYLAEEAAGRPGPTVLVSPPVDTSRDRPGAASALALDGMARTGHSITLVMVTRVDEAMKARHIETAMRAVTHLRESVTLVVVGSGDATDRLGRLAGDINRGLGRSAVRMIGELSDPRPAYAAADVVLGMGGSAARGLAFGKPLVVIGEFGEPELFTPEASTQIFHRSFWNDLRPSTASTSLESILESLIDAPAMRVRLGEFGRSFAVDHFSLDRMGERLVDLYRTMSSAGTWRGPWMLDSLLEARAAPLLIRKYAGRSRARARGAAGS